MILEYKPLSHIFQDVGQAIRVGDSRLARINVSKPRFLSRRDLPLVVLPPPRDPQQIVASKEDSTSSRHSLDVEIDQFHFEEREGVPEKLVELSNSRTEFDKLSAVHHQRLIVARPDTSYEEENMDLKKRSGLKGLMASRGKGSSSKDILDTQVPANLRHLTPPPVTTVGLLPNPDLKKKRKVSEAEEGEIIPLKGTKQPKNTRDKWALSMESKEEISVDMHRGTHIRAPRLELGGCSYSLGGHHLGVPKWTRHLTYRDLTAASPSPQRYEGP